jgi:hypothetical protein
MKNEGIAMTVDKKSEDFARIHCGRQGAELTVDFVNDVPYHAGTIRSVDLFPRVDGWWNILFQQNHGSGTQRAEGCGRYSFLMQKI